MSLDWFCIVVVALFWGGYPLIARLSDLGGPIGSLALSTVAFVPVVIAVWWVGMPQRPTTAQLWPLAVAGVMQGIGLLAFVQLASSRRMEASVAIPIADVSMLLVTTIGAILFYQEAVSLQKLAGVALLVLGIALLRPS